MSKEVSRSATRIGKSVNQEQRQHREIDNKTTAYCPGTWLLNERRQQQNLNQN